MPPDDSLIRQVARGARVDWCVLALTCQLLLIAELVMLRKYRRALHAEVRREREAHAARETEWRRGEYP